MGSERIHEDELVGLLQHVIDRGLPLGGPYDHGHELSRNPYGGAQPEIKVANTLIDQWEELTFDFTANIGLVESIDIDQIIVFGDYDLAGRMTENIVYFDNISYTGPTP